MNCRIKMIRYGCVGIGIVMIGIGVISGQPQQIFQQAIRICLECIGIG